MRKSTQTGPRESVFAYVLALHSEPDFPSPKLEGGARQRKNTKTGPKESVFAYVLALRSGAGFPSPKLEGGARRRTNAQTGPRGSVFAYVLALHSTTTTTTTTTTTQMARAASDRPLEWCLPAYVMGIQGGWGLSTAAVCHRCPGVLLESFLVDLEAYNY